jgi:hypothetical protein
MAILRFATLMVTALAMTTTVAHLLEMPARLSWEAPLWIETTVTGAVFRLFGTVGAVCEIAAMVCTVWLAFALRRERDEVWPCTFAALGILAAHAVFWLWTAPVNAEMSTWTPDAFPQDWASWRLQWEVSHAARAVLEVSALALLVGSMVRRVPDSGTSPLRAPTANLLGSARHGG